MIFGQPSNGIVAPSREAEVVAPHYNLDDHAVFLGTPQCPPLIPDKRTIGYDRNRQPCLGWVSLTVGGALSQRLQRGYATIFDKVDVFTLVPESRWGGYSFTNDDINAVWKIPNVSSVQGSGQLITVTLTQRINAMAPMVFTIFVAQGGLGVLQNGTRVISTHVSEFYKQLPPPPPPPKPEVQGITRPKILGFQITGGDGKRTLV